MLTNLEAAELVCKMADEGTPELKAFSTLTKGDTGIKGLTRAEFSKKYASLLESPLLRRLEVRAAREQDFKEKLSLAVMKIDCTEEEATDIASRLEQARSSPRTVQAGLILFAKYFPPDTLVELDAYAKRLYPDVFSAETSP